MLLLKLHLPMKMLDVAVLAEDLAKPLPDRTPVVDVQKLLAAPIGNLLQPERHQELDVPRKHPGPHPGPHLGDSLKNKDVDVDSSPSQSHTEDQGGTPLPSDTTPDKDKRLNSRLTDS